MSKRSRHELRLKLFEHFSALLGSARPEHKGKYGCPICLGAFPRSAAEVQPGDTEPALTFEDVVPKRLGKTWLVLTCQPCNNDLGGRALDSHLHEQIKFADFLSGDGKTTINATMDFGGTIMEVKYGRSTRDGRTDTSFDASKRGNNPSTAAEIQKLLANTPVESQTLCCLTH